MKKISIMALTILTLEVTSCDIDKIPYDVVSTERTLITIVGSEEARIGIYSVYLGLAGGSYVSAPEVQADVFNAVMDFSNKCGELHHWIFEDTGPTVETIWSNYYAATGRVNFFIDGVGRIDEDPEIEPTETQRQQTNVYGGEAYFTRAYCYFYLATLFCRDYDVATAASTSGLPLQMKYEPKLPATQYLGRPSLEDTYKQISEGLGEAEERIEAAENGIADYDGYTNDTYVTVSTTPKSYGNYTTVDVVTALKARVALQMDNYENTTEYAGDLANSNRYSLPNTVIDFGSVWKNDKGTGTAWQITVTGADNAGVPLGTIFIGYLTVKKDYIPAQTLIDLHNEKDIRLETYFGKYHLTVSSGNVADVYFFSKYPGNEYYNVLGSKTRYLNQPKPFRVAEIYLIATEANAKIGTVAAIKKGNDALSALEKARIEGWTGAAYDQKILLNEVINERERELVDEGYRLMDPKRQERGVKHGKPQNKGLVLFPRQASIDRLDKPVDDQWVLWSISKTEMGANPQLTGQQDPGHWSVNNVNYQTLK